MMSLPDDTYSHYTFNFSALLCNSLNLDLFREVFGLEDETITNVEPDKTKITWPTMEIDTPVTDSVVPETVQEEAKEKKVMEPTGSTIHWRSASRETDTETDAETESTASEQEACRSIGVCVDCSCCLQFCDCPKSKWIAPPARTVCNPAFCKHVVCSDCTFCTDHCTCRCEVRWHHIS